MKDKVTDSISMLVDGELEGRSQADAVDEMLRSDELKKRWACYHLMRDAWRRDLRVAPGEELVRRVRAALADEPPHVDGPPRAGGSARPAPRPWRRLPVAPVAGVALAASVAAIAILGVRSLGPQPVAPQASSEEQSRLAAQPMVPALGTTGVGKGLARQAADRLDTGRRPRAVALGTLHWDARPEVEERLNGYLVTHSEYMGNGMRGMLPYARIVGYDTSDRD